MKLKKISANTRQRLYDTANALIGVVAVYGLVSDREAAAWALVLTPLFGMARRNVDKST